MRPILSYFAAQEIPAALVTYVSFLLFIQTGTSPALSTCYSALLSLPWVMKSGLKHLLHYRGRLLLAEVVVVGLLLLLAIMLNPNYRLFQMLGVGSGNGMAVFYVLFLLSAATAWHESLADNYYHDYLPPRLRKFYDAPRLFISQSIVVLTYGVLIIMVGTLQVISRSILVSWSTACVVSSAVLGIFLLWHMVAPSIAKSSGSVEEKLYDRQRHARVSLNARTVHPLLSRMGIRGGMGVSVLLFLFLLPQALMFYTRVLFLLAPVEEGGLSCSLQEVGFFHGVIGALGFSLGLLLSRRLVRLRMSGQNVGRRKVRYSQYALPSGKQSLIQAVDWRMLLRFAPLLLSPVVYCVMSFYPPRMLWQLGFCTFLAQFMFGYGMHRLLSFLGQPASLGLRVPVAAFSFFLPMAFSGWMLEQVSFQQFFLIDALSALLPLAFLLLKKMR